MSKTSIRKAMTLVTSPKKPANIKLIVAIAAAAATVLVVGGGIATTAFAISSYNSYNAETEELCVAALQDVEDANKRAETALAEADSTLEKVRNEGLQYGAGSSSFYPETITVDETHLPGRTGTHAADLQLVEALEVARADLTSIQLLADCATRDDITIIESHAATVENQIMKLNDSTRALNDDYNLYLEVQNERLEADLLAIQKRAEQVAAEEAAVEAEFQAEADRIAAENEAAGCPSGQCVPDGLGHGGNGPMPPSPVG